MIELEKNYDASHVEADIYTSWMKSGYFNPDNLPDANSKEAYTIIMPPVNANGLLHVGHALFVTIQDTLIRHQRMSGKKTLWLPGTDHAGFETQVVFEKVLEKQGTSRFQMTREEFYEQCMEFVKANKHLSEEGLKKLGASCDWDRNIFTLDPEIVKVVYETFKQMHEDGLAYRAGRICNWCSKHQTGLSDLETKYEEKTDSFYYLKYGPFIIGTARPETKFGDKYVVVHPEDDRYSQYTHGQTIDIEWINGPITATVIKDESVDREFGTGAMTITPWHDATDFEIAKRHNLDMEQIIDQRGKLKNIAGEFAGQKIAEARPKIIEKLKEKGLVEKIEENYKHNVQVCYKCSTVIEPQVVTQWFVSMTKPTKNGKSFKDFVVDALDSGEVKIVTEKFEGVLRHWLENVRDWPISRQIWWGIPIPVKYCEDCGEVIVDIENKITTCTKCHSEKLTIDPDTFDTWFSSGQWPFATMIANDAKNGSKDMNTYFPTQLMETGWEIIFFWVARMIFLSYYRTGKAPFKDVYLHGLIRDASGQKMSKSKGNVINPIDMAAKYGTDALRFALIFNTSAGTDIPLAEDKIKGMKHFANKLWNISRFILSNLDNSQGQLTLEQCATKDTSDADKAILEKLEMVTSEATKHLDNYRLHEAAQALYHFVWHEFADVYIEASKAQLADPQQRSKTQGILLTTLEHTLLLLHPFMPFITEHLWEKLALVREPEEKTLMVSNWPGISE